MMKRYAQFSSAAIQMGVIILLGVYLGKYLDDFYNTEKKYFTLVFSLLSVAASLYLVLKKVMKISKEMEEEQKQKKEQ